MQVTAVEKPLDIVIKTRALDLVPFLQLQADLARHSRLKGRVYVVVPREERDRFAGIVTTGTVLVAAEEVAAAAGYGEEFPDTWFTQQIIKIAAANVVEHEHYLILDSNTLIGLDFDERYFISHGEYVYAVNDFRDVAWELQSRNFLGLHAPCRFTGFRAANQIFSRQNARALMRHVERLYGDNVVRVLLAHGDDLSTSFWTEFALYGVFVQSVQEVPGHWFEERGDLFHYSARRNFAHFLEDIRAQAPLMVKFNKTRPGQYDLAPREYASRVAEIKRAYQQGLTAKGAR
jgi:uncharacterized protein DUF6492